MKRVVILLLCGFWILPVLAATVHPVLLLTKKGVENMKSSMGAMPLFDTSVKALIDESDVAVRKPICMPVPQDGGGGYSHEMHKQNYYDMYACGVSWQLTGKKQYADKVKDILFAYAKLYPTLGCHPLGLSKSPGRIFWQTLNESVWLVHTAVAYDCVYDYLTETDRKYLEKELFYPMADFIMNGTSDNRENYHIFNSMHNHGTWATSAVGMIAIAMGDRQLLEKALYGSDGTGENGGFVMQLDNIFSPDGYFAEGAYYLRYAIWPFVTFAQCLENFCPELKVFQYRDGIILKAVDALLQLAYEGKFMRFNDALEKGYDAQELIYAVDIAYNADKSNKSLLSVAHDYQGKVLVSDAGYAVAKGIYEGEVEPLRFRSIFFRDGHNGRKGGFGVLRSAKPDLNSAVTFKATSHGLGHGHFDKLTFAYYDNGNEIITDYGAVRFINIDAKYHGHYTRENRSYSRSTIAHNTLVVDEESHFKGNVEKSSEHWPEIYYVSLDNPALQIVSAVDENAVPGVRMHRVLAYADVPFLEYPLIIDILKADSESVHQYDYPIHYNGQMISLNVPYTKATDTMSSLGKYNGYQHLWVEAEAFGNNGTTSCTWLTGNRMYSISTATDSLTMVKMTRIGAGDPDFNLRPEPMYLLREKNRKSHLFASCIETHGKYDLQVEQSANLDRSCRSVEVLLDTDEYAVVRYVFVNGKSVIFAASLKDNSASSSHYVHLPDGFSLDWTGAVHLWI